MIDPNEFRLMANRTKQSGGLGTGRVTTQSPSAIARGVVTGIRGRAGGGFVPPQAPPTGGLTLPEATTATIQVPDAFAQYQIPTAMPSTSTPSLPTGLPSGIDWAALARQGLGRISRPAGYNREFSGAYASMLGADPNSPSYRRP